MSKRVAVIAVHGVGSPPRDSTARGVAKLLTRCVHDDACYDAFVERGVTIRTDPIGEFAPERTEPPGLPQRLKQSFRFDDRVEFAAGKKRPLEEEKTALLPDVEFMREQLRGYVSKHTPYETIELTATRKDGAGCTEVHVYEMHWADLSRVGSGALRVLGAIYQLILHVCHLGRKTVDIAWQVAKHDGAATMAGPWRWYAEANANVVRLFTIPIPLGSLLLFAFALLFVPAAVPAPNRFAIGFSALLLIGLVALGLLLFFDRRARHASFVLVPLTFLVVAGVIWRVVFSPGKDSGRGTLLVVVMALVATLGYFGIVALYQKSRPGAFGYGLLLAVVVVALSTVNWVLDPPPPTPAFTDRVRYFGLLGFQWSYVVLMLFWGALWLTMLLSLVLRLVVLWRAWRLRRSSDPKGAEWRRALRASWTARVTMVASIFFFIITALVAYRALVDVAVGKRNRLDLLPVASADAALPLVKPVRWMWRDGTRCIDPAPAPALAPAPAPTPTPALTPTTTPTPTPDMCTKQLFGELISWSGTAGLRFALYGIALAGVLVAWFLLLIAVTSIRVPEAGSPRSEQLGTWMTDGFWWLRRAGDLLSLSIFTCLLLGGVVNLLSMIGVPWRWLESPLLSRDDTEQIVGRIAFIAVASAATLAALRLRLEALATRARPALGIVLDVDNYLRESPADGTPRAQMAERFASLLRFVGDRADPDTGTPWFDHIVIVSHSQGTVITADLLRFLNLTNAAWPVITRERYRLLTMGSPLRQLYAANFPHLYRWVDATDDEADGKTPVSISRRSPDPADLRVHTWVNLYTTGDYVGRTIWRHEHWPGVWLREDSAAASSGDGRRERCLGAGTHTRYWSSSDVAEEIDRLIAS